MQVLGAQPPLLPRGELPLLQPERAVLGVRPPPLPLVPPLLLQVAAAAAVVLLLLLPGVVATAAAVLLVLPVVATAAAVLLVLPGAEVQLLQQPAEVAATADVRLIIHPSISTAHQHLRRRPLYKQFSSSKISLI